ncbi:MAG: histidine phosphatase family protein [Paracoccaceae bacterium]
MTEYPEIFVLRHGQTEWNSIGRHQGRLDSPLTDLGRRQAHDQSAILGDLICNRTDISYYCSPQGRASDTAAIALDPLAVKARTDDRLCEISFGLWQGLTFEEISDGWPELCKYADLDMFNWNFAAPGGERFEDVRDRAESFLNSLTGPTVIVTHGITSRVLRGLWLGVGQDEMAALEGGQGCVYHLSQGKHRRIVVNQLVSAVNS